MKKVHSKFTPSKTVIARERLLEQQNQRITHHYNEMSPDEMRLFEHTLLEEFFTKNPDLKPMGGIDISWCKVLCGIVIIHTPLSVGSIVSASTFHNAELYYIAIISHRRSTYNLLKARGKRSGSSIIVFPTFVLVAILRSIYGPFSSIRGVFHTMSNNIENVGSGAASSSAQNTHYPDSYYQQPSNASDNIAVNKSTLPKKANKVNKVIKTKVKARATSMERVSMEPTEEEYRRLNEDMILSRVIQLERALGRQPCLIDLLRHFTSAEIDAVRESLDWLYPGIFSIETTVPELIEVTA